MAEKIRFSVIVPLYNKRAEIGDTVRSILAQTYAPFEVVVVDDGSTDGSGEVVRGFGSPLIRLIEQPNAGECAARNRAIAEARGDYIALLDADDTWEPGYLEEIARLIGKYPGCGLYGTAFTIVLEDRTIPALCAAQKSEGVSENYFREMVECHFTIPSATTIPASVFREVGGFPEGMRLAGDQYMWVKIGKRYNGCFSPKRLVNYSTVASNRSAAIYKPEQTAYSFREFYDPAGDPDLNEYLAKVELGKAIVLCVKGDTAYGREVETFYAFTRRSRRQWWRLFLLNRLPRRWRRGADNLYKRIGRRLGKESL